MKMSSSISSVTISHHATAKFNETHQNSLLTRLVCMYEVFLYSSSASASYMYLH